MFIFHFTLHDTAALCDFTMLIIFFLKSNFSEAFMIDSKENYFTYIFFWKILEWWNFHFKTDFINLQAFN